MTITFDEALATVRQLAPRDRARLVARIVEELAEPSASAMSDPMNMIRAEFAALRPEAGSPAEILEQDRRERDALLMGQAETDVHA